MIQNPLPDLDMEIKIVWALRYTWMNLLWKKTSLIIDMDESNKYYLIAENNEINRFLENQCDKHHYIFYCLSY